MNYISLNDINGKVKEVLGEKPEYKLELVMTLEEELLSQRKTRTNPFFRTETTAGDISNAIKTLTITNMGALASVLGSLSREQENKIRSELSKCIEGSKSIGFSIGGLFRKYISFNIQCSLGRIRKYLADRNLTIVIGIKVT